MRQEHDVRSEAMRLFGEAAERHREIVALPHPDLPFRVAPPTDDELRNYEQHIERLSGCAASATVAAEALLWVLECDEVEARRLRARSTVKDQ